MKKLLMMSLALTGGSSAEVALTIYNENLAVVRDTLPVQLKAGENTLSYERATAQVIPDSVVLRDPTGRAQFALQEQSYRNDPVSQGLLLSLFEGKEVPFQKVYPDGKVEMIKGKVVRSGYQPGGRQSSPVIETDKGLQFSLPGEPLFPSLGDDSILRPTLSWTLGAGEAVNFDAQLSYLSRGLTWEASYNLVAPEEGELVTLSGWITANNRSGTSFEKAKVKLVAGDVNVQPQMKSEMMMRASMAMDGAGSVEQKAFDDFHLYTLPRAITLRDQETKQVEFLRSAKVVARKSYLYDPVTHRFHGGRNTGQLIESPSKDVAIYWNFSNTGENGLGVPMPAGTVRFYREDSADGNLEFVGENRIDHTPSKEELKIYTGNAFDLVGERKVTDFQNNDRESWARETIEITLKNRSKKVQTITAREHLWRWSNWEVESAEKFEKTDSNTIEFTRTLQPDEVQVIEYQVVYSWK
ncbi:hypothetical protein AAFN60_03905 [Roseibacillus persicicus]|uniref:DUF4139 domain-containing protein n=1 Tax=Roseibacillus persicicus TaxID=454148 RepID=UPI00398BB9AC